LIQTSCTILDLGGIGVLGASKVYGYVQEASKIGQNYYPETMGIFTPQTRLIGRKVLPHQFAMGILYGLVRYKALA
jgi:hypothetical protein